MKPMKNLQKTKKQKTNGFGNYPPPDLYFRNPVFFFVLFLFFEGFLIVSLVFIGFTMVFIGFLSKTNENNRKTNENKWNQWKIQKQIKQKKLMDLETIYHPPP